MKDRFPLMTDAGERRLRWLTEHPHAPRFTHPGCERLDAQALQSLRAFERELGIAPRWAHGEIPMWLEDFVARGCRDVPFYRRQGLPTASFFDLPTTERADLNREPWSFVPDTQLLDGLLVYNTSGATGHPLSVLSQPETVAKYMPLLRAALATRGVTLEGGPERVAVILVCFQKWTFTYAAVSAFLDQAGFAKLNLYPAEWRNPDDRAAFLDDCDPEVYTGDPYAFAELARLPLRARPKALVSTAMALHPGLRQKLEARFACPVLDVYSMNESGPIASENPRSHTKEHEREYRFLQPKLYVEILDPDGAPCPPGTRGEITLSGGFNPFLPLLRYRTGDYASLEFRADGPVLVGLEGRPIVTFRTRDGRPLNNVDVNWALRPFPIAQYALHQAADGSLTLRVRGSSVGEATLREALLRLFGPDQPLAIELDAPLASTTDKLVSYTSELA